MWLCSWLGLSVVHVFVWVCLHHELCSRYMADPGVPCLRLHLCRYLSQDSRAAYVAAALEGYNSLFGAGGGLGAILDSIPAGQPPSMELLLGLRKRMRGAATVAAR